jgi:hypothetical protein
MASVQEIREWLRGQRIEVLRKTIEPLLAGRAGAEVWLRWRRIRAPRISWPMPCWQQAWPTT